MQIAEYKQAVWLWCTTWQQRETKLISRSHWVWNCQWLITDDFCAAPPLPLTPPSHSPNHAYQALLHFLQDSIFFVKAWIQEVHLSFPKAFKERDTQGAWNILQVLNPVKRIKMVLECKPDCELFYSITNFSIAAVLLWFTLHRACFKGGLISKMQRNSQLGQK